MGERPAANHKALAPIPFSIGCLGKQRFDNHDEASSCIRRTQKRGNLKAKKAFGKLAAYRCRKCEGWHIGTSGLGR